MRLYDNGSLQIVFANDDFITWLAGGKCIIIYYTANVEIRLETHLPYTIVAEDLDKYKVLM
jgi:hypothetical protein